MSTSTGAGGGRGGGGRGGGGGGRGGGAAAAQSQSTGSSSQSRSRHSARIIAQTNVDARLDAEFEECGAEAFDYSRSVQDRVSTGGPPGQGQAGQQQREGVMAYLQHIQRGRLIQPFGCLLALDDKTLRVLAFSANAPDMLTALPPAAVPSLDLNLNTTSPAAQSDSNSPVLAFGCDARSLFTAPGAAALQKAAFSPAGTDVSLLNPILVHCRSSGRPFYAILHRTTRCLIVDLEPVKPADLPMTAAAAGALQSYKLAAKAIARLQSLPGGGLRRLCDAVVEELFELTGYDRVMTYRFHDDDHGEVFAEITKPGLDPYLGLHYPATDIPQAARFLFMKNRVRMICDCRAKPVAILQDDALGFEVSFCGSTLRAPHSCHLQYMENMNSIASLVMAVVINDPSTSDDSDEAPGPADQSQKKTKKLWGLLVCHNESPRFVPFPLRYACEFLAQVFAIHVNKELELDRQVREKNILRTQTLLCDMLLRKTGPISIVSGSPSIMDLVKCDGAALLYQNKVWRLGLAPAETQIRHLAHWLTENHMDSTGLCTDSLLEAGYPGAAALGDMVCGMAAAQINSRDVVFWFRSHTAAEIRWGGAKHDSSQQDDGRKMHPRSSFKAFLEVVKMRSLPWNDYEMDAVHSLQLILRGTISSDLGKATTAGVGTAELESRIDELRLESMVELQAVTNEMVRLIETASVPILAVDDSGLVNGWNKKIAELTGLTVDDAIGKHMLSLVEEDSLPTVKRMLYLALQGKEEKNVQFQLKTHGQRREDGPVILIVNACSSRDINENVVGVCFVAQDMTGHKMVMDRFTRIEGDYKTIIQNPNPLIPPIFGADEFGWCSEWNAAMARLSGWPRDEVLDKMLLGEVFGGQLARCRMKNQDSFVSLSIIINNAMTGQEKEKVPFGFYTRNGKFAECLLSVTKKVDGEGSVTGVFCFLHVTSHELQRVMQVQQLTEQTALKRLKALAYIRQETRNPLSGMMYCRRMIQNSGLNEEQKKLIDMGSRCQRQLSRILDDLDLDSIMDSCLELEMVEFELRDVITIAVSQVLLASQEKGVRVVYDDLNEEFMSEGLYGDGLRLQQIIADFLAVSVKFSPSGGLVELTSAMLKQPVGQTLRLVKLEITIKHTHTQTGSGMAEELVSQMFGSGDEASEEGLGLLVCRKILKLMNGDVRYLREASKSAFILSLELATAPPAAPKIYKPQPIRPFS